MRATLSLEALAVLALAFGLGSCGGSDGGAGSGTGTLQVRMHDTPVDEAEHVYVTVARVEVMRPGDSGEAKETLTSTPAQYDLLELQNGVSAVLGTGEFPAGEYSSIRLVIDADSRQDVQTLPADQLKNYIVIDGTPYALVVPSGAQTGIKLNHHFTLSEDEITVLTLDFDVRQSVHQRGHQPVFNLRPTIRLVDTVVSGRISGTVTTDDASPLPAGTVVSAQQVGVEIASATVDLTTGAYSIGPLLAGTYDLVVIAPGYDFASETGVAVVAQEDATGHDFTITAAGTGDIGGTVTFGTTLPEDVVVRLSWNGFAVGSTGIDPVSGVYAIAGLPAGTYDVTATDGTSSDTASGVAVTAGGATTADLTLP